MPMWPVPAGFCGDVVAKDSFTSDSNFVETQQTHFSGAEIIISALMFKTPSETDLREGGREEATIFSYEKYQHKMKRLRLWLRLYCFFKIFKISNVKDSH